MDWTWKIAIVVIGLVQGLVAVVWGQLNQRIDKIEKDAGDDLNDLGARIDSERTEREQRDREILARVDVKHDLIVSRLDDLREAQAANAHTIRSELHQLDKKLSALGG